MRMSDLVDVVAERSDVTKIRTVKVMSVVSEEMQNAICMSGELVIPGLGRFFLADKIGGEKNIFGKRMLVPDTKVLKFKPTPAMRFKLNPELRPEPEAEPEVASKKKPGRPKS